VSERRETKREMRQTMKRLDAIIAGIRDLDTWQTVKRLDAIIRILLETAVLKGKPLSISKRIEMLDAVGLRPVEISEILGKTLSYITVELTRIRRSRSRGPR